MIGVYIGNVSQGCENIAGRGVVRLPVVDNAEISPFQLARDVLIVGREKSNVRGEHNPVVLVDIAGNARVRGIDF